MHRRAIQRIAFVVMSIVLTLASIMPAQASTSMPQTITPTVYWGAMVDGKVPSLTNLQGTFATFETRSRKRMSIIHWGQPWKMRDGSWGEFHDIYREVLTKHDHHDVLRRLEEEELRYPEPEEAVGWLEQAGLTEVSIEAEQFELLFRSSREFFFAPVVEYGPLPAWKEIAGKGTTIIVNENDRPPAVTVPARQPAEK